MEHASQLWWFLLPESILGPVPINSLSDLMSDAPKKRSHFYPRVSYHRIQCTPTTKLSPLCSPFTRLTSSLRPSSSSQIPFLSYNRDYGNNLLEESNDPISDHQWPSVTPAPATLPTSTTCPWHLIILTTLQSGNHWYSLFAGLKLKCTEVEKDYYTDFLPS